MRTQVTPTEYRQIVEGIYRLSDSQRKKLFAEIKVAPTETEAEKSPYNPEFVKKIQEREKGKFISMEKYQDLWK